MLTVTKVYCLLTAGLAMVVSVGSMKMTHITLSILVRTIVQTVTMTITSSVNILIKIATLMSL